MFISGQTSHQKEPALNDQVQCFSNFSKKNGIGHSMLLTFWYLLNQFWNFVRRGKYNWEVQFLQPKPPKSDLQSWWVIYNPNKVKKSVVVLYYQNSSLHNNLHSNLLPVKELSTLSIETIKWMKLQVTANLWKKIFRKFNVNF